jgi:hypothetical protein
MSRSLRSRTIFLRDTSGYQMDTRDLKAAFGIPSPKDWPAEGFAQVRYIRNQDGSQHGCYVYVKPRGKGSKHRAFAICPKCARHIPAGRMHQHAFACF